MSTHTVIERTGRDAPDANGYFVQNAHRGTVAGPYADRAEAWREVDRLDAREAAEDARTAKVMRLYAEQWDELGGPPVGTGMSAFQR